MASGINMASGTNDEVVAVALRELSVSGSDQQALADFLTEYFGTTEQEELGNQ